MAKVRFDYTMVGLVKKDSKVAYKGLTINNLPQESKDFLADYGLFVNLTRTLAGHEKDSLQEKNDLIQKQWDWLMDGMPKRERTKSDPFMEACIKVLESDSPAPVIDATIKALESAFNKRFDLDAYRAKQEASEDESADDEQE